MGVPCVTAAEAIVSELMAAVEADPAHDLAVDLDALTATYRGKTYPISVPAGARQQLLAGTWDATRVLLEAADAVRTTAARLPYVRGFRS
jgi:3-isopropylmalate/(R)-2-methylmalate dehydratase small subunit